MGEKRMTEYCAWCGSENPPKPCAQCGNTDTTTTPPSDTPCDYCGARPTWSVEYLDDGKLSVLHLCAKCDQRELQELQEFEVQ